MKKKLILKLFAFLAISLMTVFYAEFSSPPYAEGACDDSRSFCEAGCGGDIDCLRRLRE